MVGGMKPLSMQSKLATILSPPDAIASPTIDLTELTGT
jgi:hypothetical protein